MAHEHGEIRLYCSEPVGNKFSPKRTRSGRVFDSKLCDTKLRRRSQQSDRSRNSSGQSGASGSVEDFSENDDCETGSYTQVLTYLNRNPRCRLDLSDTNFQEIPISPPQAFNFENLFSPKKIEVRF